MSNNESKHPAPPNPFPPPPAMMSSSQDSTTREESSTQQQQQGSSQLQQNWQPVQQQQQGNKAQGQFPSQSDAAASISSYSNQNAPPSLIDEANGTGKATNATSAPSAGSKRSVGFQSYAPSAAVPTYTSSSITQTSAPPQTAKSEDLSIKPTSAASSTTSASATTPGTSSSTTGYTTTYPTSYTSSHDSQYPSPYLSPPAETLKSRNVPSQHTNTTGQVDSLSGSGGGYLLNTTTGGVNPSVARTTKSQLASNQSQINNNGSIALLIVPPLFLLLIYEMPSSLPLLFFLCIGLIVYALDLANVGSGGSGGSGSDGRHQRGFYTLSAIWIGWLVLSFVVGYVTLVQGDVNFLIGGTVGNSGGGSTGDDGSMEGVATSSGGVSWMALGVALSKLSVSIMLLFCLSIWTTLQCEWLPDQMPTLANLLERILYSALPPISAVMVAYGLTASSLSSTYISWGMDATAILLPHLFAFHLVLGIFLVGAAPSMFGYNADEKKRNSNGRASYKKDDKKATADQEERVNCAIHPREGRMLSNTLVFLPAIVHLFTFRQRMTYSYASWDDLFDFVLISTVPYIMHYLLASNDVLDEKWRRSLFFLLKAGTSPVEGGRTLRGASIPMGLSLLCCISFQQRYLVPLCSRASYIINGHDGIISPMMASMFLTLGTTFAYITVWFFGRKNSSGEFLLGEYHEDVFQLLLGASSIFFGLSCSPPWTFLPVPMLAAVSLALWVITKQLRYALLTIFVLFTCGTILIAYRLTFLSEFVEILPGRKIILKTFAQVAMSASLWLIALIGLVHRAPGGILSEKMKKWDFTGLCLVIYGLVLVAMEFSLLREPMPLYSRDNFEVGRVAVYSPSIAYFTGFLILVISSHLKRQKVIKIGCFALSSSIAVAKMIAVFIESNMVDSDGSLRMLFFRWGMASALLITLFAPYAVLKPMHLKMSMHTKRNLGPSGKPGHEMPKNATLTVALYCAVVLPLVIVFSCRLVLEPLVGLLSGHNKSAYYATSPRLSEIAGNSASLWGIAVLSMTNHFLPDGGAELLRKVSALTFLMGLFLSFSAPAIPGSTKSYDVSSHLFQSVSSLDVDESNNSGGWGLISAFLAIFLAMIGPLELRQVRDASGRKDSRQLLRLMIFGIMFGCGLSWFITMQSMSKDIFIPIFVTTFSCMAMSFLGTVAAVMGYFLETKDFVEAEQIANVWAGVGFPVFFIISSVSLSAHAHPFGIGGWASTYLSVCGLAAGAFSIMLRLREEKNSTTRGYGNMSCIISWLCAVVVVYGRYGIAGVGVVGVTTVAGIPVSVLGTFLVAPILLLLEGEKTERGRRQYNISSSKSKKSGSSFGLELPTLTQSNWFAPLLAGTIGVFVVATLYAIFLRGCGLSKFSLLFGTGDVIKSQDDVFSHVYGSSARTTGAGSLDDVATMAKKSVVHTRTMIAAARLSGSGIWTSKSIVGPIIHMLGLLGIIPSLRFVVTNSWHGTITSGNKITLMLPLNFLTMAICHGIPSLVAAATIGFFGSILQMAIFNNRDII